MAFPPHKQVGTNITEKETNGITDRNVLVAAQSKSKLKQIFLQVLIMLLNVFETKGWRNLNQK